MDFSIVIWLVGWTKTIVVCGYAFGRVLGIYGLILGTGLAGFLCCNERFFLWTVHFDAGFFVI
jgi:hypothetical protein